MIMKHYLVLCYKDCMDQTPAKRMVLHEGCLSKLSSFSGKYGYVLVEPLDSVE